MDNSNLFIGAQVGQGKNGRQDAAIRIHVKNLVGVIYQGKLISNIKTRIVGGSIPPRNARVWKEWESCRYDCLLGERTANKKVSGVYEKKSIRHLTAHYYLPLLLM